MSARVRTRNYTTLVYADTNFSDYRASDDMGLDITAYKGVKKLGEPIFDEDGDEIGIRSGKAKLADGREVETFTDISDVDFTKPYSNPNFPLHIGDLDDSVVYGYDDAISQFSCGYIGYAYFKDDLARIAGYESGAHLGLNNFYDRPYMATVIHDYEIEKKERGLLSDLLYFADSEGSICNSYCQKILADLKTVEHRKGELTERHQSLFDDLLGTFAFASNGGFVQFY